MIEYAYEVDSTNNTLATVPSDGLLILSNITLHLDHDIDKSLVVRALGIDNESATNITPETTETDDTSVDDEDEDDSTWSYGWNDDTTTSTTTDSTDSQESPDTGNASLPFVAILLLSVSAVAVLMNKKHYIKSIFKN